MATRSRRSRPPAPRRQPLPQAVLLSSSSLPLPLVEQLPWRNDPNPGGTQAPPMWQRSLALRFEAARARAGSHTPAAVDHAAVRVLVGLPRDRSLLVDARLREVAHAVREELLQLSPLVVRERQRAVVVVAVERPQLALVRVGRDLVAGHRSRRPVDRYHRLAAQPVRHLVPVAVVAAVAEVARLIARDLLGTRLVGLVL